MKKVLLVEDENLIRRGLKFQMDWTAVNCVVAGEAASGQEGLEQIQNLQPDIVITDIRMPDMDGLEMLAAGQAECPFDAIIISGYSEFEYAQQAIHLGVSEYLLKPVDLNELRSCLQKLVSRRQEGLANSESSIPSITSFDPANLNNRYAATMLQYIQQHYAEHISLTDLSQELNISCTHLKAVELQKQRNYKLYEIAELVGFSDYKYFNKVYKRYVGYAPNKIFPTKK